MWSTSNKHASIVKGEVPIMKTKNAMARFFLLLGLCTGMAPVQSPAGDVENDVTASKSQWFVQLSAGAPTMINRGFVFSSVVIGTTSNSVLSGRVDSPGHVFGLLDADSAIVNAIRSEEHTSELQSHS